MEPTEKKKLRDFGLLVGGVFGLIGFWGVRLWALILASLLIVPALLFPNILKGPYHIWMRLASILGWINSRLILGLVFYLVFTPIAWVMRLAGKDPLDRAYDKKKPTYRLPVSSGAMTKDEMERQF